ncbi:BACON domain-containing protein [Bacteroides fragilis]|uniref:BACON domain-containing protein n=2 Tax=Bacteroides fragilis TaxID=817 RepID=UPI00202F2819|nr:BACON domain-containing carbohydrate-binding protein [Bacteroides fragilis]
MPKMPAYDFTVSPTTLSVPALDKSAHPFVVTSQKSDAINGVKLPNTTVDIAYDLTSKPDWATVANGNIVFSENRVTTPRTGTITFTQTESNLTTSIDVQQDAGVITNNYTFALNDGSATASWTGVAAKGATNTYTIVSIKDIIVNGVKDKSENMSYTASSNANWITVSGSTLTVAENRVASARAGTVTFTQAESGKKITVTVQQVAGIITNDYKFTLSDGSITTSWTGIGAGAISKNFAIVSNKDIIINGTKDRTENVSYSASSSAGWITVSGSTISVSENRGAARTGTVTFTQAESGKKITVTVQQVAGVVSYNYKFTLNDGSTSASWTGVSASGSSKGYSIVSNKDVLINGTKDRTENVSYSASSSAGWITVSGSTISVSENRGAARTGTVTFTQAESGKRITVTVQQVAGVVSYNYKFTLNDGSTSASWTGVSASGSSKGYSIVSNKDVLINGTKDRTENVSYSASSSAGWITVSGSTISVSENRGGARSGTVTFTQAESGKKITVTVQQSAGVITSNYTFSLSDGSTSASWTSISSSGDSKSYSINSSKDILINGVKDRTENVGYTASSNVSWITVSGSTVTVQENMSTTPRGGVVTFTQSESGKTIKITLLQLKKSSVDIE